jgi:thiol-disulfide isomerase/thioredoxin
MLIDFQKYFERGFSYSEFLEKYATPPQLAKWSAMHGRVELSDAQKQTIGSFRRKMPVLCMTGAWCGDCVEQCPIFDHFAAHNELIQMRYIDRDADELFKSEITTCGGARVPTVIFLNEDFEFVHRMGDRTLAKYRAKAEAESGPACPSGIGGPSDDLLKAVIAEWLNEFERVQLLLQLSAKLRQRHGD